ncbi:MAG TPA: branched-chain amino acid ABC transporter substrate-binding protein [Mycobacteriales bacterium]|nr:branched-chain amino acid ABC transporter substrate-binding protein [Mycobacteriales bacterium]
MRSRRLIKIVSPLILGAMALSACGGGESDDDTSGSSSGGDNKIVKIGLIAPLSGDLSSLGLGMRNAVELAIRQANEKKTVKGYTLQLAAEDDTATANVGAQVATKLAGDNQVAAVVGTLNSSVAQQVQPILDKANIAMVSPANTNPTLTQGDKPDNKVRPFKSYFRVATTDAVQGPFAAQYVFNTIGKKKVAVVHDKKTYGQGLTDAFKSEFTKLGGTVVSTETVGEKDTNFAAVISKIKPLAPELVYYGGEFPVASLLSPQLKAGGLKIPLMGGDGIFSGKYIETGKAAVEGDLSTSVGAPVDQLDTAKQFVTDYEAAKFAETYEAYGAYAYDAANAIINALAKALDGKDDVAAARADIISAIQDTDLKGVTGDVKFDEFGDTTTKVLTVYKVVSGKWAPEKVDTFK